MSGAAERGDVDRVLTLLQEFGRSNVVPDAETFSFCFESLGKNLRQRSRNPRTQDHLTACLVAAERFLTMMEERDIAPTHHIVREYVELLCLAGQVSTATSVVREVATVPGLLGSKTIYRVAMANAQANHIDVAKDVASLGERGEVNDFLLANIKREASLAMSMTKSMSASANQPMIFVPDEDDDGLEGELHPPLTDTSQQKSPMSSTIPFWRKKKE